MNHNLTDITLVIDRSSSMESIRPQAETGINNFIAEQKMLPGEALLTLVQFNTSHEFVHRGIPIAQAPPYRLRPGGSTALLDAVGMAINETGARLAALPEADRPGLVVFVIMTDGEENSSEQFTREQIREMVAHQQTVYNWKFNFLGANQDSFAEARKIGILDEGDVADFMAAKADLVGQMTSRKLGRMRHQSSTGQNVSSAFTDQERKEMK